MACKEHPNSDGEILYIWTTAEKIKYYLQRWEQLLKWRFVNKKFIDSQRNRINHQTEKIKLKGALIKYLVKEKEHVIEKRWRVKKLVL